ncbi:MAG: efflux RND transporter periplasmic adaptor subunit [Erythrobacter sp.]|uniref:efflux RND transporter periplasmic adaptor subunit n=1 Tax=Erythrobacter sp. TaxID=1042 RepID=UPI00260F56FF|nr:efflux RND transporter periplasmic adaptor subunit [Erythrobacter sp.]MDJ0979123.1 efflux RND transporter periplasmic adaptor subunit [Erythrobacter sp.]
MAILAASALALAGCGAEAVEVVDSEPKPAKLMVVKSASETNQVSFPAVIRSVRSTDLAFQVGGEIVEWNAIDGALFSRGDVIARLDSTSFKAAVEQAEAQFINAESEYKRALRLIEEDAVSQSVVESREAQMQVAEAELDTAQKNLSDTVLRAPFTGGVGLTYVEEFQNVGPQQPVLVLQSRAVEAIVNVPASFVLTSNQRAPTNIMVELDAAPGRQFPAVFREARGVADSSTQTFEAHFSFTPPSELLVLTGMTATLFFESQVLFDPDVPDQMEVPLSAIMVEGDKRLVWVVEGPDKTLGQREVTIGDEVGEMMRVTSGLKAGETIVSAGGNYLREGDRVRPWSD